MSGESGDKSNSLSRNLGRFLGHIKQGLKAPVEGDEPRRVEVSRTEETEERDTPRGRVTVRRTTIEEVDLPPDEQKRGG